MTIISGLKNRLIPYHHYFFILQYGTTGQVDKNSLRYRISEYDDSTPGSVKLSSYSDLYAWLNTLDDTTLRSEESDAQNWSKRPTTRSLSSVGDFL
mmetsp:Transcript_4301/g.9389  ORF Transcript_4301/g.9389 Transcript_4301/m.9389 type:complete len:96 (-) Transcript_4301:1285-1572(-)